MRTPIGVLATTGIGFLVFDPTRFRVQEERKNTERIREYLVYFSEKSNVELELEPLYTFDV